MKHTPWIASALFGIFLGGCDLANRFSREERLGIIHIGEPTQIYATSKASEKVGSTIPVGSICLITEVELQKTFAWFHVYCEIEGKGWIRGNLANRTYFPER